MKKRRGITLIALVVTIIILLILASVTISLVIGSDGVIERAKNSQLDSRYGTIMDKIKVRETDIVLAFEKGEDGEHQQDFINRLVEEGLITSNDGYDNETFRTIYLGRQENDTYKYIIDVADALRHIPSKNMTLIIRTTAANQSVTLPISNTEELTINWDVENNINNFSLPNNPANPTYEYSEAKEYEVQIKGKSLENTIFGKNVDSYVNPNIIGIKDWGENGFSAINSFGQNLIGTIPFPSTNSFISVISFQNAFIECSGLTGSIPGGLFANCPNVTNFKNTFSGCSGLTGDIPGGLFANCPNVTTFSTIFYKCSGLTSIPSSLFANCSNVTSFSNTFNRCSGLTSIPANLFANCPSVTSFGATFSLCTGLTSIPGTLFANCQNVTNFGSTFSNCTGLISIPAALFTNCPNVTTFNSTFYNCTGLTESIPSSLFTNNTSVTSFTGTFYKCNNLSGLAPSLWMRIPSAIGQGCFYNCTTLLNHNLIPNNWKDEIPHAGPIGYEVE